MSRDTYDYEKFPNPKESSLKMFPNTRSVQSEIDPIVASLTSSQRRQIVELYGEGKSQLSGKWEPIPDLTLEQIKLVMAEENLQHRPSSYTPHDYRTTQTAGMYEQQRYGSSGVHTRSHESSHGGGGRCSPSRHAKTTVDYSPSPQSNSSPPVSYPPHPSTSTPHPNSGSSDLTGNLSSLSITDNLVPTDNDYSIMIIGVTGSGKSTACNFFFNKEVFNTRGGAVSVTIKSDAHSGIVHGKKVLFIDTPGFSDAYESEELRMADLGRALYYAQYGVHAIVICFNGTARFDTATEGVVNALDQLGTFWPHAFVLYSHADDMGSTESEQKQQIFQWINNPRCPERLKWLLCQVQYRFMTVESKMRNRDHAYRQQKCKELLSLVEQVHAQNNYRLYTNKLFKWAKQKYDQAKQEKKKQEEELKKCLESLTEHQELLKSFEEQSILQTKSHQQAIDELQEEIKSLQQQQNQSHFSQEQEELYLQLLTKQATEQEERNKLESLILDQRETFDQIRQTLTMQQSEQNRLQSLQSQSVMEQYMKSMQEDIHAIKTENKELRDRLSEAERQGQHHTKVDDDDTDDGLMDVVVKGATTGAKEIIDRGAKYVTKNCSVM